VPTRDEVARTAGAVLTELATRGDRGLAIETMASGLEGVVRYLFADSRLHGMLGMGGSSGTSLITPAIHGLPIGVPKLMVSTVASRGGLPLNPEHRLADDALAGAVQPGRSRARARSPARLSTAGGQATARLDSPVLAIRQ